MSKTRYFGYTLRNAGTPYQQWILNEVPICICGVYTSNATASIGSSSIIPVSEILMNQIGGRVNADGSFSLPQGLYKIEYSMILSTTTTSPVQISLNAGSTTISQVQSNTSANSLGSYTTTITGIGIVKSAGNGTCSGVSPINYSLVNNSSAVITPVSDGSYTVRIVITRIV